MACLVLVRIDYRAEDDTKKMDSRNAIHGDLKEMNPEK
jgi:hypothetical protein